MFEQIRNREAPTRHVYVQRPAYIITEEELARLEEAYEGTGFHFGAPREALRRMTDEPDDGTNDPEVQRRMVEAS